MIELLAAIKPLLPFLGGAIAILAAMLGKRLYDKNLIRTGETRMAEVIARISIQHADAYRRQE